MVLGDRLQCRATVGCDEHVVARGPQPDRQGLAQRESSSTSSTPHGTAPPARSSTITRPPPGVSSAQAAALGLGQATRHRQAEARPRPGGGVAEPSGTARTSRRDPRQAPGTVVDDAQRDPVPLEVPETSTGPHVWRTRVADDVDEHPQQQTGVSRTVGRSGGPGRGAAP